MTENALGLCGLCISMNSLSANRKGVSSVRGVPVCEEHFRELAVEGSRAASVLKKIADNVGAAG